MSPRCAACGWAIDLVVPTEGIEAATDAQRAVDGREQGAGANEPPAPCPSRARVIESLFEACAADPAGVVMSGPVVYAERDHDGGVTLWLAADAQYSELPGQITFDRPLAETVCDALLSILAGADSFRSSAAVCGGGEGGRGSVVGEAAAYDAEYDAANAKPSANKGQPAPPTSQSRDRYMVRAALAWAMPGLSARALQSLTEAACGEMGED